MVNKIQQIRYLKQEIKFMKRRLFVQEKKMKKKLEILKVRIMETDKKLRGLLWENKNQTSQ